ncbi:MBOAT family O-acyltransferase, partial [Intestinimonas butyriciproducens]|uniref:MBOAT family O-acyltransferase n=1 Tax=Intestinimonas butyriciproducens TaxID=1297617 RepID=UPI00242A4755
KRQCRYLTLPIAVSAGCNLGLLFVFKYLVFTVESLNTLGLGLQVPVIELPIGISFFTFQALSYVLDVAMDRAEVQRSPLDLGLYISFFPQLIAGPIVKYADVAGQIAHRQETWADFSEGCVRFLTGLGKKVLIANQAAVVADRVFAMDPAGLSVPLAWLGSLCYTFQIYYDFSGYSDMAIGLGLMFGFRFRENFEHPYAARSISEFWRRWHISLSTWFRDYVYIPLGGSRRGPWRTYRNLFVVWLLTGVWHGANWTFLCWGLFYFLLLCLEKLRASGRPIPAPAGWAWTFLMVNFGWVLFRAPSLPAALDYLGAMFSPGRVTGLQTCYYCEQYALVILLSVLFSFPVGRWLTEKVEVYLGRYAPHVFPLWDMVYGASLLLLFLASSAFLVKGTYNPFIYFNF